jgi:hypothetical protein
MTQLKEKCVSWYKSVLETPINYETLPFQIQFVLAVVVYLTVAYWLFSKRGVSSYAYRP